MQPLNFSRRAARRGMTRVIYVHGLWLSGAESMFLRRRLEMAIPEDLYAHRTGTTDSEAIFLLMFANGLASDPHGAVARTLAQIEVDMRAAGITDPLKVTAAFANGETLFAVRYSSDGAPPSLYTKACCPDGGTLVVSEPLDDVREGWTSVPAQSFVTVTASGVAVEPFAPSAGLAPAA